VWMWLRNNVFLTDNSELSGDYVLSEAWLRADAPFGRLDLVCRTDSSMRNGRQSF
jgi:hypothetical protein